MMPFIKQIALLAGSLLFNTIVAKAQLKLGTNYTRIDSSAALEIESQKLTLLLPRISDTSTIVKTVKDGSLVYFTNLPAAGVNKGLYLRSNGTWNWLAPAGQQTAWSLPGNSGTSSSVHFLGTTDNRPLLFKTNNLTRLFVDSTTGNTGFRTGTPQATLHNQGSTLLGIKALGNFPVSAAIGTALNTVDSFTVFTIAQTATGKLLSLPAPTQTAAGRIAILVNTGTTSFVVSARTVYTSTAITLVWTGTAWVENADGIGSGAFTVPYIYKPNSSLGIMQGAGENVTTGINNIAVGWNALHSTTTGSNNIAIGTEALANTNASSNIAIGPNAMDQSTAGSNNIAIGSGTLSTTTGNWGIAIGGSALGKNTTGTFNTALGFVAMLENNTGSGNTGIGNSVMRNMGTASSNNTAMGYNASNQLAGDNNTALGTWALYNVTTGSNNTAVGYYAGYTDNITASAATVSNSTAIGAYAQITNSNTISLGSANGALATNVGIGTAAPTSKLYVNGTVAATGAYVNASDARLKKDIRPVQDALAKMKALRGITFNWNQEAAKQIDLSIDSLNHYGFIAQEVEQVLPQVVRTATDSFHTKTVAYTDIIPVLTEAMKQGQQMVENLQQEHKALQQQLQLLQWQRDRIEKILQHKIK
jgi:hypothetical protein